MKTVFIQWMFWKKDLLLVGTKSTEKISNPNPNSFIRKKNTKFIKWSKIITQQLKPFENSNIVE